MNLNVQYYGYHRYNKTVYQVSTGEIFTKNVVFCLVVKNMTQFSYIKCMHVEQVKKEKKMLLFNYNIKIGWKTKEGKIIKIMTVLIE